MNELQNFKAIPHLLTFPCRFVFSRSTSCKRNFISPSCFAESSEKSQKNIKKNI